MNSANVDRQFMLVLKFDHFKAEHDSYDVILL